MCRILDWKWKTTVFWVLEVQFLPNAYGFRAIIKLKSYQSNHCKSGTVCLSANCPIFHSQPSALKEKVLPIPSSAPSKPVCSFTVWALAPYPHHNHCHFAICPSPRPPVISIWPIALNTFIIWPGPLRLFNTLWYPFILPLSLGHLELRDIHSLSLCLSL